MIEFNRAAYARAHQVHPYYRDPKQKMEHLKLLHAHALDEMVALGEHKLDQKTLDLMRFVFWAESNGAHL